LLDLAELMMFVLMELFLYEIWGTSDLDAGKQCHTSMDGWEAE